MAVKHHTATPTGASAKAAIISSAPPRSAVSPINHSLLRAYCIMMAGSKEKRGSWRVASFCSAFPILLPVAATSVITIAGHWPPMAAVRSPANTAALSQLVAKHASFESAQAGLSAVCTSRHSPVLLTLSSVAARNLERTSNASACYQNGSRNPLPEARSLQKLSVGRS